HTSCSPCFLSLRHSSSSVCSYHLFHRPSLSSFFFNDTATTEIYTLSLHDALPICPFAPLGTLAASIARLSCDDVANLAVIARERSEEHTSELQSRENLVCRLLLEKKKKKKNKKNVRINDVQARDTITCSELYDCIS